MKTHSLMGALHSLICATGPAIAASKAVAEHVELDTFRDTRRGKGQRNRRGSGKRNPPKSRPNRLIVSKRVRRKHRRAA